MAVPRYFTALNVIRQCHEARLGAWSCPPFLFIVLGFVNISAIVASYLFAARFVAEPEIAALIVTAIALVIFVIGNFIISGFTQIAEANRIESEFIAIVSHQLRSPLSIFKWVLGTLLQEEATAGGTARLASLQTLRENTEKMIQLVNTLLEVSRIEGGHLLLRSEPVRIDLLTDEVMRSFTAYARASNLTLEFVRPSALAPVRADPEKIKMVIQNLLDNAIRYSNSGGRIVISASPLGMRAVEWQVKDSGMGIPATQQRHIFQKFYRSPEAVRRISSGSGLGLYIARSVVTALDGDIGFTSAPEGGTTFWFRLPTYTP